MANEPVGPGAVLTFNSTPYECQSISFTNNGNPIDLTNLGSSTHEYWVGITDPECTAAIVGQAAAPALGATGALSVTYNDTGTDTMTLAVVTNVETSADVDSPLLANVTFKPAWSA